MFPAENNQFREFAEELVKAASQTSALWPATPFSFLLYDTVSSTMDIARGLYDEDPTEPIPQYTISRSFNNRIEIVPGRVLPSPGQPFAVIAESQTAGRGRSGRAWTSPLKSGLYITYLFSVEAEAKILSGISLVIGLAVQAVLDSFKIDTTLKWPNDVLYKLDKQQLAYAKLAGILVDTISCGGTVNSVLIGIGINLRADKEMSGIGGIGMEDITGAVINKSVLVSHLTDSLYNYLPDFFANGFKKFRPSWEERSGICGLKAKVIDSSVVEPNSVIDVLGVDDFGLLRFLKTGNEYLDSAARIELIGN